MQKTTDIFKNNKDKKAYLTPGKRTTAVCVWRLVFAISPLFDAP